MLVCLILAWQILYRLPLVQAKSVLEEANSAVQTLAETNNLLVPLKAMDLDGLKVRDRASVQAHYQEAQFARESAQKNLDLSKKKISFNIWGPIDQDLLSQVSAEIDSYHRLMSTLTPIYKEAVELFDYYEASSLAIYNLLYYDPQVDLATYQKVLNYDYLVQSYGQSQVGLEKTVERIGKLPDFEGDSLKSFTARIENLAVLAGQISNTASTDEKQAALLAQAFIPKITTLQDELLAGRRGFWQTSQKRAAVNKKIVTQKPEIEKARVRINLLLARLPY